ncbi:hypothetical protein A2U01_0027978, partial [Trifolium medium]|nr:hypothetical protein [Trifolium medium]
ELLSRLANCFRGSINGSFAIAILRSVVVMLVVVLGLMKKMKLGGVVEEDEIGYRW